MSQPSLIPDNLITLNPTGKNSPRPIGDGWNVAVPTTGEKPTITIALTPNNSIEPVEVKTLIIESDNVKTITVAVSVQSY